MRIQFEIEFTPADGNKGKDTADEIAEEFESNNMDSVWIGDNEYVPDIRAYLVMK